jgi:hypothetical protein
VDLIAIENVEDIHFVVARPQLTPLGRQHGLLPNFAKVTLEPERALSH